MKKKAVAQKKTPPVEIARKPMDKAITIHTVGPHVNLRCPNGDYYAKTTRQMLKVARLVCPIHKVNLLTPAEREETRGRANRQLKKAA